MKKYLVMLIQEVPRFVIAFLITMCLALPFNANADFWKDLRDSAIDTLKTLPTDSAARGNTSPPQSEVVRLNTLPNQTAAETVTVFVDGITPWKAWSAFVPSQFYDLFVGASNDRQTSRLRNSPLDKVIGKELSSSQEYVVWSGSPSDTINLDRAISETLTKIMNADRAGKDVNLVTHSMGTVVGYLALARYQDMISQTPSNKYRGVANFVTLASPLGSSVLMGFLHDQNGALNIDKVVATHRTPETLMIRGSWINVHAQNDPIGTKLSLPWVKNNYLSFTGGPIAAHSLPFADDRSVQKIVGLLKDSHTKLATVVSADQKTPSSDAVMAETSENSISNATTPPPPSLLTHSSEGVWIYWLGTESGGTLQRTRPDGSGTSLLVKDKDTEVPTAFCVDKVRNLVYLAHSLRGTKYGHYQILRTRLDGTIISTLFEGTGGVRGITVSEKTGQLFWTEADGDLGFDGRIRTMTSDGSGARVVLDKLKGVGSIVVSDKIGTIFWVEHRMGVGLIHRSHVDGTSHKVFRDVGGLWTELAVDDLDGKLYWLNSSSIGGPRLIRSNFDGSEMEDVQLKELRAFTFAVDPKDRKIYFDGAGGYKQRSLFFAKIPDPGSGQAEPMRLGTATGSRLSLAIFSQSNLQDNETSVPVKNDEGPKEVASGVRFELDKCERLYSGNYRHVTAHVARHIDLSNQTVAFGLLDQAAKYATRYCRSENNSLANIDVNIFQDGRRERVVHARNYDENAINWREFQNRAFNEKQAREKERQTAERRKIELEEKRQSDARIARAAYTDQGLAKANNVPKELLKLLNIEIAKQKEFQACRDGCKYMDGVAASECTTGCRDFEVFCSSPVGNFSRADRANGITEGRYIGVGWLRYGPPSIPGGLILHSEPPKWNEDRSVFKYLRINGAWVKQDLGIWSLDSCP